jgi:hypothetical protein
VFSEQINGIHTYHEQFAMSKIHYADDAENKSQANTNDGVHATQQQSVKQ